MGCGRRLCKTCFIRHQAIDNCGGDLLRPADVGPPASLPADTTSAEKQILTANISGLVVSVRAIITNTAGELIEDCSFPSNATVLRLEAHMQQKLGWPATNFFSDDGSVVPKRQHLKEHTRLTMQGHTDTVDRLEPAQGRRRWKLNLPTTSELIRAWNASWYSPQYVSYVPHSGWGGVSAAAASASSAYTFPSRAGGD